MNPRTFTIKPLVWKYESSSCFEQWWAEGFIVQRDRLVLGKTWTSWYWMHVGGREHDCNSCEIGKALCAVEHERRLLACLDEVGNEVLETEQDSERIWKETKGMDASGQAWMTPRMIRTAIKTKEAWEAQDRAMPLPNPPKTEGEV